MAYQTMRIFSNFLVGIGFIFIMLGTFAGDQPEFPIDVMFLLGSGFFAVAGALFAIVDNMNRGLPPVTLIVTAGMWVVGIFSMAFGMAMGPLSLEADTTLNRVGFAFLVLGLAIICVSIYFWWFETTEARKSGESVWKSADIARGQNSAESQSTQADGYVYLFLLAVLYLMLTILITILGP